MSTTIPQKLKSFDDYVNKGIEFFHEKTNWTIRFSDNYDTVCQNNRQQAEKTIWMYVPSKFQAIPDLDLARSLAENYKKWDIANELDDKNFIFAMGGTRVYSIFAEVPFDQLNFAHRFYTTTFLLDDPVEESCLIGMSNTFGKAYLANLKKIVTLAPSDTLAPLDNYTIPSDKRDNAEMTQRLIALNYHANLAQRALTSVTIFAKTTLSPKIFEVYQKFCLLWFDYLAEESRMFEQLASSRQFPDYHELLETRVITIGLILILAGITTNDEDIKHLDAFNPFLMRASTVCSFDNDIVSLPKETRGKDFSPANLIMTIVKIAKNEIDGVRISINKRNALVKMMEDEIETLPKSWKSVYLKLGKAVIIITEFGYILGDGFPNFRYGWTWRNT